MNEWMEALGLLVRGVVWCGGGVVNTNNPILGY
jgi:hypothetical protein